MIGDSHGRELFSRSELARTIRHRQHTEPVAANAIRGKPHVRQDAPCSAAIAHAWVRNNAAWWADGLISDTEFVSGIKHLVEHGLIIV